MPQCFEARFRVQRLPFDGANASHARKAILMRTFRCNRHACVGSSASEQVARSVSAPFLIADTKRAKTKP